MILVLQRAVKSTGGLFLFALTLAFLTSGCPPKDKSEGENENSSTAVAKDRTGGSSACSGTLFIKSRLNPLDDERISRFLKTDDGAAAQVEQFGGGTFFVKLPGSVTFDEIKDKLKQNSSTANSNANSADNIEFAPNSEITADEDCAPKEACEDPIPNWIQKIGLENVPDNTESKEKKGIVAVVMDTGVNVSHPDLAPSILRFTGGFSLEAGQDVIKCESNSYGFGFNPNLVGPGGRIGGFECNPQDEDGHGSAVAGIIGGFCDGKGVRGVDCGVQIVPVKVLFNGRSGCMDGLIRGVRLVRALKNSPSKPDIRVINMSLGSSDKIDDDQLDLLRLEIAGANDEGILVVASAGDLNNVDIRTTPHYPASFCDLSNLISVSAVGPTNLILPGSSIGADIAAPGGQIVSTGHGSAFRQINNTSAAAPFVSGASTLLIGRCDIRSPDKVKAALITGATQVFGEGSRPRGTLNICGALAACLPQNQRPICKP